MGEESAPGSQVKGSLFDRVAAVIDELRPMVQSDGGDLELVSVDAEGVVSVRMHGACVGCPSSSITLTMGVERCLRDRIPEVSRVVQAM